MSDFDIDQLLNELGVSDDDIMPVRRRGEPDDPAMERPLAPKLMTYEDSTPVSEGGLMSGRGVGPIVAPGDAAPQGPPELDPRRVEAEMNRFAEQQRAEREASRDASRDSSRDASCDASIDGESGSGALVGLSAILEPEQGALPPLEALVDAITSSGAADAKALGAAKTIVRQTPGLRLVDVLLDQGAEEEPIMRALAGCVGLPFVRVQREKDGPDPYDGTLVQRLSVKACRAAQSLPLRVESDAGVARVVLATARPDDAIMLEDIRLAMRAPLLEVVVCPLSDIRAQLDPLEAPSDEDIDLDSILGDIEEDDVTTVDEVDEDDESLEREATESPVIRYVNYIIQSAVKEGASDIHIEPGEKALKVRFRIDGILFEMMQPPHKMAPAITSRLKIMANLDISERRVPQDGRIRCTVNGRKYDLRMSTLPTNWGEKTVLRILDQKSISVGLDDLGFGPDALHIWKNQIEQPHGVVLVTGPTGSGKTTTLYASLRAMDKKSRNISTVEDPIEYQLEGITQTGTNERAGMTFAKALKALLRQDPDIIMVGEIRDMETAHIAIQAALTGHLVLSTLHTNDAPSSITRLVNIGIEPFLLGAAINAALAQRLVRKICPHCAADAELNEELREFAEMQGLRPDQLKAGKGCDKCRNLGYAGRLGLYELLMVDDGLRDIIARNPNVSEFRRKCCERGMVTLREDGFAKVGKGLTTVQEVLRVTEATI
ncbi:MAG: GspE/PulE family protein [Phycisphaerales bacterium]